MFRRLFGESKSKDNRSNDLDNQHRDALRTINQLQQSEQIMNKKLEKFDEEISNIQNKARQCLTKTTPDRLEAIRLIKRRKQLEQQKDQLLQMKQNIQLVNEQVQSSHFNRQLTDSLNIGQQHLKRAQKSMPIKQIEQIIDNLAEQIEISNEMNYLLATPITTTTTDLTINDIQIENELNHLNKQIILENITEINLPNVHSGLIKLPKSSINDINQQLEELKRLTTE